MTCRMQQQAPHLSTNKLKVKRRRDGITRAERTPSTPSRSDLVETDILLGPKETHDQLEIHRRLTKERGVRLVGVKVSWTNSLELPS